MLEAADVELGADLRRHIPDAVERAMAMSFDEYRSQVVAYLDSQQVDLYESRSAWDAMQESVVERWLNKIPSARARTLTQQRLARFLAPASRRAARR